VAKDRYPARIAVLKLYPIGWQSVLKMKISGREASMAEKRFVCGNRFVVCGIPVLFAE